MSYVGYKGGYHDHIDPWGRLEIVDDDGKRVDMMRLHFATAPIPDKTNYFLEWKMKLKLSSLAQISSDCLAYPSGKVWHEVKKNQCYERRDKFFTTINLIKQSRDELLKEIKNKNKSDDLVIFSDTSSFLRTLEAEKNRARTDQTFAQSENHLLGLKIERVFEKVMENNFYKETDGSCMRLSRKCCPKVVSCCCSDRANDIYGNICEVFCDVFINVSCCIGVTCCCCCNCCCQENMYYENVSWSQRFTWLNGSTDNK